MSLVVGALLVTMTTACGEVGTTGGPPDADRAAGPDADPASDPAAGQAANPSVNPAAFEDRAGLIVERWPEVAPLEGYEPDLFPVEGYPLLGTLAGRTITVSVGYGPCDLDYGTWLHETPELVVIGTWRVPDPRPEQACPEIGLYADVPVRLEQELGDRTVVDAASAREVRIVRR
jgi:hypothetical protein